MIEWRVPLAVSWGSGLFFVGRGEGFVDFSVCEWERALVLRISSVFERGGFGFAHFLFF